MGDRFLSNAGAGGNCARPMSLPDLSPVLDKNRAPMDPEMLSSTGAGVWKKAPMAFPDSSSVLDKFQSAIEMFQIVFRISCRIFQSIFRKLKYCLGAVSFCRRANLTICFPVPEAAKLRSFEKGLADRGGWREEILHMPEILNQASFLYPFFLCPLRTRGTQFWRTFWGFFGGFVLPPTPLRNL